MAAYYVASEALANVVKYADASCVTILLDEGHSTLRLSVRDDGIGGADPGRGSGLNGIRDRVAALSGSFELRSPVGDGTLVRVLLPT